MTGHSNRLGTSREIELASNSAMKNSGLVDRQSLNAGDARLSMHMQSKNLRNLNKTTSPSRAEPVQGLNLAARVSEVRRSA